MIERTGTFGLKINIDYLKQCDNHYYNTGEQLVSDKEYDRLKSQAKEESPNDPYFKTVGHAPAGSVVKLPYILGSLNKTKPDGSLLKWCKDNDIKQVIVSDKLDGVSVYAKYVGGKLVLASTRGDGYEGRDITEKVKLIQPTVSIKEMVELRGEALMTPQHCEVLGYSLPRSAVAGVLNGEDQEHLDKCEFIDILFYTVLSSDKSVDFMDMGVGAPLFATFEVNDNLENTLTEYLARRKSISSYDIDGLVISDPNDTTVGEDYHPSNMVAFKTIDNSTETTVTEIEWNVSRLGRVVPTVCFEEVNIGGSRISRATGFNAKYIKDNKITVGTKIGVIRSGDVIPYLVPII